MFDTAEEGEGPGFYTPPAYELRLEQARILADNARAAGLSMDSTAAYEHVARVDEVRVNLLSTAIGRRSIGLYNLLGSMDVVLTHGDQPMRLAAAVSAMEIARSMVYERNPGFELFRDSLGVDPQTPDIANQLAQRVLGPEASPQEQEHTAETIHYHARSFEGLGKPA